MQKYFMQNSYKNKNYLKMCVREQKSTEEHRGNKWCRNGSVANLF